MSKRKASARSRVAAAGDKVKQSAKKVLPVDDSDSDESSDDDESSDSE